MPGDRVYVLGSLERKKGPSASIGSGEQRVVRPLVPATGRFFDRLSGLPVSPWYGVPPNFFLLTDGKEDEAKARLFGRWRRRFVWAALWTVASGWFIGAALYALARR
jgi:hypothetical protein